MNEGIKAVKINFFSINMFKCNHNLLLGVVQ